MKKILLIAALCSICFWGCQRTKHSIPDHVTLTWTEDPHSTQTITWRTEFPDSTGNVQYAPEEFRADFNAKAITAKAVSILLKTDLGTYCIHTVTIKNLMPGKRYCYNVGLEGTRSLMSTFTTESTATTSFRFLIFGDSQSGDTKNPNYGKFDTTIHNAFKTNPDAKFFINIGDLVEAGGSYQHWNNWFKAAEGVINSIPIMPVEGNHETYNAKNDSTAKPVNFTGQFKIPNGRDVPNDLKGEMYSYNYGNVHFSVLSSQFDEEEKMGCCMKKEEADWLDNDLKIANANANTKWKIVMFHKSPYYNKHERSNDNIKTLFQPIIDKYHVDVVINGHDHVIAWTYPIKGDKYFERPSEGTVYYIAGRSGKKFYKDNRLKVWNAFPSNQNDMTRCNDTLLPNYMVADVNDERLTITAFAQSGDTIDKLIIDKSKVEDRIIHGNAPFIFKQDRRDPIVVIYGEALDKSCKPELEDNIWYIPAKAFCNFFKGNYCISNDSSIMKIAIKINGTVNKIDEFNLKRVGNSDMISSEEIKEKFGFIYHYDENRQMLIFSKDVKD